MFESGRGERGEIKRSILNSAKIEYLGNRTEQQDYSVNAEIKNASNGQQEFVVVVCDGHGDEGAVAAKTVGENLLDALGKEGAAVDDDSFIMSVFKDAHRLLDAYRLPGDTGVSATLAKVRGDKIKIAFAGDTLAAVLRGNQLIIVTEGHRAGNPKERKRLMEEGATIDPAGYVESPNKTRGLQITRSLGDLDMRDVVSHRPEIKEINIEDGDKFLIVATDGLWDAIKGLPDTIRLIEEELSNSRDARDAKKRIEKIIKAIHPEDNTIIEIIELT